MPTFTFFLGASWYNSPLITVVFFGFELILIFLLPCGPDFLNTLFFCWIGLLFILLILFWLLLINPNPKFFFRPKAEFLPNIGLLLPCLFLLLFALNPKFIITLFCPVLNIGLWLLSFLNIFNELKDLDILPVFFNPLFWICGWNIFFGLAKFWVFGLMLLLL